MMKKMLLYIMLAIFGAVSLHLAPGGHSVAYGFSVSDEKKNDKKEKKDPPGPPVVREKQPKPQEPPPRKNKRP
jgi:hypothetical protein